MKPPQPQHGGRVFVGLLIEPDLLDLLLEVVPALQAAEEVRYVPFHRLVERTLVWWFVMLLVNWW